MDEAEFRAKLDAERYDDVTTKVWAPGTDGDFHTHDFTANLLVTEGRFTVVLEDGPVTFEVGEWCHVPAGTKHYEQTGDEGATVLAGIKK